MWCGSLISLDSLESPVATLSNASGQRKIRVLFAYVIEQVGSGRAAIAMRRDRRFISIAVAALCGFFCPCTCSDDRTS
jgi:hypothetical protein